MPICDYILRIVYRYLQFAESHPPPCVATWTIRSSDIVKCSQEIQIH